MGCRLFSGLVSAGGSPYPVPDVRSIGRLRGKLAGLRGTGMRSSTFVDERTHGLADGKAVEIGVTLGYRCFVFVRDCLGTVK